MPKGPGRCRVQGFLLAYIAKHLFYSVVFLTARTREKGYLPTQSPWPGTAKIVAVASALTGNMGISPGRGARFKNY
jgi:hypothetical protein